MLVSMCYYITAIIIAKYKISEQNEMKRIKQNFMVVLFRVDCLSWFSSAAPLQVHY